MRRAFDVAYRTGDLTFSAYGWHVLITNYLTVGDPLAEVQAEAENALAFVTKAGFGLVSENAKAQLGLIRTLRGLTIRFGCFDDDNTPSPRQKRTCRATRRSSSPSSFIGPENFRLGFWPATTRRPSPRHRGPNGYCGRRHRKSRQVTIDSLPPSLMLRRGIRRRAPSRNRMSTT